MRSSGNYFEEVNIRAVEFILPVLVTVSNPIFSFNKDFFTNCMVSNELSDLYFWMWKNCVVL